MSVKSFDELLGLASDTKKKSVLAGILTRYPQNKIYSHYYEDKLVLVLF
jgi:hypothetical protein